jgi:hypothetical protein
VDYRLCEPIGVCIYCESTEDLRDEHVIPYSLGGKWFVPKASCKRCGDITSAFEGQVAHRDLLALRTAARLPSRRRRERPAKLPLSLEVGKARLELSLDPEEHPAPFALPVFHAPRTPHSPPCSLQAHTQALKYSKRDRLLANVAAQTKATGWWLSHPDLTAFAQLIAKVGYTFAVATLGFERIAASKIRQLILDPTDEITCVIGGDSPESLVTSDGVADLRCTSVDGQVRTHFRLFGREDFPVYVAIVGSLRDDVAAAGTQGHRVWGTAF